MAHTRLECGQRRLVQVTVGVDEPSVDTRWAAGYVSTALSIYLSVYRQFPAGLLHFVALHR